MQVEVGFKATSAYPLIPFSIQDNMDTTKASQELNLRFSNRLGGLMDMFDNVNEVNNRNKIWKP
jgi:hypothetical protein